MIPQKRIGKAYHFCVMIPDMLYPFSSIIEGKKVRFRRSYEHTLEEIRGQFGEGHFGIKLTAYREFFHVVGAALFILTSTVVSRALWGTDVAIPVLFVAGVCAITYQEFYFHPKYYAQLFKKSVLDWFSWTIPLAVYVFFHGVYI
jgi:hypothetical protein